MGGWFNKVFEEPVNTTGYSVAQSKDKVVLYMLYRVVDEAIL